jgi:orotate phosphoribosyltransferase
VTTEIGRAVAQLLSAARAIHVNRSQPYILAAGWASPVYVDCRVLVGKPEHRSAITALAEHYTTATLPADSFDAIAGAETAGIPFASWLADRMSLKLRYVRKRPLGIGRHAQIEGGSVEGLRVLLVDDLTTDGASKLAFARGLRAAGAIVEHALTIFYHDAFPGAAARLERTGLRLHSLATWADVLRADTASGLAPEFQKKAVDNE